MSEAPMWRYFLDEDSWMNIFDEEPQVESSTRKWRKARKSNRRDDDDDDHNDHDDSDDDDDESLDQALKDQRLPPREREDEEDDDVSLIRVATLKFKSPKKEKRRFFRRSKDSRDEEDDTRSLSSFAGCSLQEEQQDDDKKSKRKQKVKKGASQEEATRVEGLVGLNKSESKKQRVVSKQISWSRSKPSSPVPRGSEPMSFLGLMGLKSESSDSSDSEESMSVQENIPVKRAKSKSLKLGSDSETSQRSLKLRSTSGQCEKSPLMRRKKEPIFPDELGIGNSDQDKGRSFLPSSSKNDKTALQNRGQKFMRKPRNVSENMQKKVVQEPHSEEGVETDDSETLVSKTSFAVAAIGVAAAGLAATTSQLFDPQSDDDTTQEGDTHEEKDIWDIFSASDDGTHEGSIATNETASFRQEMSARELRQMLNHDDNTIRRSPNSVIPQQNQFDGESSIIEVEHHELGKNVDIGKRKGTCMRRLICRSERRQEEEFFDFVDSRLAQQYPDVKMVADTSGDNVVVGKGDAREWYESHNLVSHVIPSRKGPQSLYTYEYDSNTYMDVRYEEFGTNPRDLIQLHEQTPYSSKPRKSGTVTVRIEASTISYSDCRIRQGNWWGTQDFPFPIIPGVDMIGKIDGIDRSTRRRFGLQVGDRVMALTRCGGNARYMSIAPEQLVKVPPDLEPAEAVCLLETYLAAFQALHSGQRLSRYKPNALAGKVLLVLGSLTNIGRAAIELATTAGVTQVYAPCKDKHRAKVRAMGATPMGLKKEEWMPLLFKKADIIIDGTVDIDLEIGNYFSALNDRGVYVLIGRSEEKVEKLITKWSGSTKLICSQFRSKMSSQMYAYDVFEKWNTDFEGCKRDVFYLMKLLQAHVIVPTVLDRIPLYKVAKVHDILDKKRTRGFLVCEPWMKSTSRAVYL